MFAPLLSAVLAASGAPDAGSSSAEAVIARVVKAYGGMAAIKKSSAGHLEAKVFSEMRRAEGREVREWQLPGRLRIEIQYPSSTELRLLDGEDGWRGDAAGLSPVTGAPKDAMLYQLLRLNPAVSLLQNRARVTLEQPRRIEELDYPVLHLALSPELELDFLVDPRTQRVTRVEGLVRAGGHAVQFATAYDQFREVDGVLFPFLEENFASGMHTGRTTVQSVTFGAAGLRPFRPAEPKPATP